MESKQPLRDREVFVQFLARSKKELKTDGEIEREKGQETIENRKENDLLLWFHFPKYSSSSHT